MNTCSRPRSAGRIASPASSMSRSLHRASAATTGRLSSVAMSRTLR